MSPSSWQHGKLLLANYISLHNMTFTNNSMTDGLLLRPTRPALSIDSTFVQRAFGSGGPKGHVAAAFTEVSTIMLENLVDHNCFSKNR